MISKSAGLSVRKLLECSEFSPIEMEGESKNEICDDTI